MLGDSTVWLSSYGCSNPCTGQLNGSKLNFSDIKIPQKITVYRLCTQTHLLHINPASLHKNPLALK